ncbi:hypothetical protein NL532_24260 [Mesorhizobium sp. C120A]|nr:MULTISPECIES: GcrA family cell cycle regulator [unclassified Mesorhizobium]ESZ60679.1 hypothetical protein X728_15210 [Mesorhizobium sp. L103C120A0]WJI43724.1 hypothetical protein NL532_24260 [Mesorhizobium sp. C120A]
MSTRVIANWTADEDATLAKLINEGDSASMIGKRLGRPRSSVCGRAHRKGMKFKGQKQVPCERRVRFVASEDQTIRAMAASSKSSTDIAKVLVRSASSVKKRAKIIGAKLDGKGGGKPRTEPKAPKAKPVKLNAGNIANKRESRTHDPEFKHSTPAVAVVPLMVALVDLRPNQCRFPVGDPLKEDFGFCGHPMEQGSYCRSHARLAYQAPESRRRAA